MDRQTRKLYDKAMSILAHSFDPLCGSEEILESPAIAFAAKLFDMTTADFALAFSVCPERTALADVELRKLSTES
jgi:hypothetical protein